MTSHLTPYLGFRDDARQAMEFYQSVFGGELTLGTFGEMHAVGRPGRGRQGHACPARGAERVPPHGVGHPEGHGALVDEQHLAVGVRRRRRRPARFFAALSAGGTVIEPLTVAPWGDEFGMLTDRFGVTWMVNVTGAGPVSSSGVGVRRRLG